MKYLYRNTFLILSQVLFLSSCSFISRDAANTKSFVENRNDKNITWTQRIVNSTFEIVNIDGDFRNDILIEKQNIIDLNFGSHPYNSKIIVTAREGRNGKYDKVLWRLSQNGDDAEQHHDFIRIIDKIFIGWDQNDIWDDVYYYCEVTTGRILFSSTSDLFPILSPRINLKRFICVWSGNTPGWNYDFRQYPNPLGLLRYVSLDEIIEEYMISGDIEERPKTPDIKFNKKNLPGEYRIISVFSPQSNPDENIFTDFYVILRYNEKYEIKIPVVSDHLDIDNAIFSEKDKIKIIPIGKSKTAYLSEERFQNIEEASLDELKLLKNEIKARNGYKFENTELNNYYKQKIWYFVQEDELKREKLIYQEEKVKLKKIEELEKNLSR
jgi:hypothetical protein